MPDADHSTFHDNNPVQPGKTELSTFLGAFGRPMAELALCLLRRLVTVSILGATVFLLCQCHRPPTPPQAPIPTPTPTVTSTPSPSAVTTPVVTPTPSVPPTASTSPLPQPTPSSTADPFAEGIKHLLEASGKGFLELRGKFKRTENGS